MASAAAVSVCSRCGINGHSAAKCSQPFLRPQCTYCKKMGHTDSTCYAKRRAERDEAERTQQLSKEAARKASCVCWRCGEVGHQKADCVQPSFFVNSRMSVEPAGKDDDTQSDSTRATTSVSSFAKPQRQPRKGERFDAAVAAAAAAAEAFMATAKTNDSTSRKGALSFGRAAFALLRPSTEALSGGSTGSLEAEVAKMVVESVPGVAALRGQRGERLVTEMLTACYIQGLFMHGPPTSPLNTMIIPAIRHIFAEMVKLPPQNSKRVACLSTLAYACQDCQQVQAREILRILGDLTAQNETLECQLRYSLVRLKEVALNCYISKKHAKCDLDYTQASPWQQRPHLWSAYVALIGESFGLDGVTAAKSDRFLTQAQNEIGQVDAKTLIEQLSQDLSVDEWLQMLLADINNQADGADRLISRECIFKWAQANMSAEAAYSVFFDEDRATEFADQEPRKPTEKNMFQPFLSRKVLINILKVAGMLRGGKTAK